MSRRQLQQRMDLTPRRIVADGDAGGEVDSTVGAGAEINNFPAHHHRVRDGNDVIFAGENFGRQHANLADLTLIIGEVIQSPLRSARE